MSQIGVIECFFGPEWPDAERRAYADFLARRGMEFYLYAPKRDAWLRKHWKDSWPREYLERLRRLRADFSDRGIRFGVAISPMEVSALPRDVAINLLKEKVDALENIGVGLLGLFFDDMPVHAGLAETQIGILEALQAHTSLPLLFCPSFYSDDPILDRVFGQRPENYLEDIGQGTPAGIEILWTGPKVISEEIPAAHLAEVTRVLRRKPFLCDNFFANDGPKNCKFLKLRPPVGRTPEALAQTSGWGFNLMNQPALSRIALASAEYALCEGDAPDAALARAEDALCSPALARFLRENRRLFLKDGLDAIPGPARNVFREDLRAFDESAAKDVGDWLSGSYLVGPECLTD